MQTLVEFMNRDRLKKYTPYSYFPKDTQELISIIRKFYYKEGGYYADLNCIDTSKIEDMSGLFGLTFKLNQFDGDISGWDVSNVKDMSYMFADSHFKGDISDWNVSNVENMRGMFLNSKFNGNINNWEINPKCQFSPTTLEGCPLESHPPRWYKG